MRPIDADALRDKLMDVANNKIGQKEAAMPYIFIALLLNNENEVPTLSVDDIYEDDRK